jgi:hypothetical protein
MLWAVACHDPGLGDDRGGSRPGEAATLQHRGPAIHRDKALLHLRAGLLLEFIYSSISPSALSDLVKNSSFMKILLRTGDHDSVILRPAREI